MSKYGTILRQRLADLQGIQPIAVSTILVEGTCALGETVFGDSAYEPVVRQMLEQALRDPANAISVETDAIAAEYGITRRR